MYPLHVHWASSLNCVALGVWIEAPCLFLRSEDETVALTDPSDYLAAAACSRINPTAVRGLNPFQ